MKYNDNFILLYNLGNGNNCLKIIFIYYINFHTSEDTFRDIILVHVGSGVPWLDSPLQCYNMGHDGYGINLYVVLL